MLSKGLGGGQLLQGGHHLRGPVQGGLHPLVRDPQLLCLLCELLGAPQHLKYVKKNVFKICFFKYVKIYIF